MVDQLSNKIVSMLRTVTKLQDAYDYEEPNLISDPAATVTLSSNAADYRTTSENQIVYAFTVRLWVKRTKDRTHQNTERIMRQLVDSVTQMFHKYYTFGISSPGNTLVQPTGYQLIYVEAIPSAWYYVERGDNFRMAEITVRCHVDVDVTLIS